MCATVFHGGGRKKCKMNQEVCFELSTFDRHRGLIDVKTSNEQLDTLKLKEEMWLKVIHLEASYNDEIKCVHLKRV